MSTASALIGMTAGGSLACASSDLGHLSSWDFLVPWFLGLGCNFHNTTFSSLDEGVVFFFF